MAYRDAVLADSPTYYLEFEDTLSDSTSAESIAAGGLTFIDGRVGRAVTADGTSAKSIGSQGGNYSNWSVEGLIRTSENSTTKRIIWSSGTNGAGYQPRVWLESGMIFGRTEYGAASNSQASSTTVIADGTWHHFAVTATSGRIRIYIDGVLEATASTAITNTTNLSSSTYFFGAYTTANGENYVGDVDELAFYTTGKAATVFSNHVAALPAAGVNAGYTAQPMTASAAMPNAIGGPVVDVSIPTGVMNASTTFVDPAINLQTATIYPSVDLEVRDNGYKNTTADPILFGGSSPESRGLIKFNLPSDFSVQGLVQATLKVRVWRATGTTGNGSVNIINSSWTGSESGTTLFNLPKTLVDTISTLGVHEIDVTEDFVNFNGFMLTGPVTKTFELDSSEDATVANRPTLTLRYEVVTIDGGGVADPIAADAAMGNAGVSIGDGHNASPMTASAAVVDPTIVAEQFVETNYSAQAMTASAMFQTGMGFSDDATVDAGVGAEAAIEMVSPNVETTRGAVIKAGAFNASVTLKKPAYVNDQAIFESEDDDRYFQRIKALGPKYHLRLNEQNGVTSNSLAEFFGVTLGRTDGPDGRHSAHFDSGDYIKQKEPTATNVDEVTSQPGDRVETTLEFSFRTTKNNQFLMGGRDQSQNPTYANVAWHNTHELYLSDGKLALRQWNKNYVGDSNYAPTTFAFTAFTNLADGEWHTVNIRNGFYNLDRGQPYMEVWIDGRLEIRRYNYDAFIGFPDYIGWRPAQPRLWPNVGVLPSSQNFEGDMSEVVFIPHIIEENDVTRNFYAFMGWRPIEAQPIEASATMPEGTKGKGNQKRALYLYWRPENEESHYRPESVYAPEFVSFDPNQSGQNNDRAGQWTFEYGPYKAFAKNIVPSTPNVWRDPVTDEHALIDLERDVNLDDYDIIMFKDWPDEGGEIGNTIGELDWVDRRFPGQKERLIKQLRDANDRGIGLFVTNPRLAVDLGIIDRVEWVSNLLERKSVSSQGNAAGLYDYGSAAKFPWNIAESDGMTGSAYAPSSGAPMNTHPDYLAKKAYFYHDTNHNNRFRVRALVEGLTDIPSWHIEDTVFHVDYDMWGWNGSAAKYLKREDGLRIGDEYIFHGSMEIPWAYNYYGKARDIRQLYPIAVPPGHVKAGTVVTTFGATHWKDKTVTTNPYKDYATTIVVQPGDTLQGRPVGGRIFVNFTEKPSVPHQVVYQITPKWDSSVEWPGTGTTKGPVVETPEQQEWDLSWTRATLHSTTATTTQPVAVTMPDGSTSVINLSAPSDGLSMTRSRWLYASGTAPRLEMTARGLIWLSNAEPAAEGDAVIRTTAVSATAEMPKPKVVAERDNVVNVQAMIATGQMPKVAEDVSGDAQVVTLPMTARAEFTGFGKTITVAPMTATAEFVENFNMVHADGEQVVLTLHGLDLVTLYLKEEA